MTENVQTGRERKATNRLWSKRCEWIMAESVDSVVNVTKMVKIDCDQKNANGHNE